MLCRSYTNIKIAFLKQFLSFGSWKYTYKEIKAKFYLAEQVTVHSQTNICISVCVPVTEELDIPFKVYFIRTSFCVVK